MYKKKSLIHSNITEHVHFLLSIINVFLVKKKKKKNNNNANDRIRERSVGGGAFSSDLHSIKRGI